eukprot:TRINITY_DN30964_c0_g1_i1.p1 TRINITY_DN30964_c0_g1~~TRINITY_DN30964_c0_g1_i1.p1  ORF type:complete len:629 (-),score=173.29 TRINITY_DN30964_c0_g1_i1:359-2245(-)
MKFSIAAVSLSSRRNVAFSLSSSSPVGRLGGAGLLLAAALSCGCVFPSASGSGLGGLGVNVLSSPGLPEDDFASLEEASEELLLERSPSTPLSQEGERNVDAADAAKADAAAAPQLIRLRRESVPIYRRGKIASFKTSYSGIMEIGQPAQEFRMVFDTGSGNVIVPAAECRSESCRVHRRYDVKASHSAYGVQADGSPVKEGEASDQATIGFGSGSVTGEFVRDQLCVLSAETRRGDGLLVAGGAGNASTHGRCMEMNIVVAVEMSTKPFKSFNFDGILGLGMSGLAISPTFSAFAVLSASLGAPRFGAFLTDGEDGEESEMALGGHNPARVLEPLSWAPAAMPEMGYWQVEILAVRVNGVELDICADGSCRGVVDTGTSHLGVPTQHHGLLEKLLTVPAQDALDCRAVDAPEVEFQLRGFTLRVGPGTYMRRLPLRPDVNVGSRGAGGPSPEAEVQLAMSQSGGGAKSAAASAAAGASTLLAEEGRICRPRMLPVKFPAPLGPNLFILGEPILHRYYTVFDWKTPSIGFGLANTWRNTASAEDLAQRRGVLPKEVDMLLMQQSLETTIHRSPAAKVVKPAVAAAAADAVDLANDEAAEAAEEEDDAVFFMQLSVVSVEIGLCEEIPQ